MIRRRFEDKLALAEHYLAIEAPQKALDSLSSIDGRALEDGRYFGILAQSYNMLGRRQDTDAAIDAGLEIDPESVLLLVLASESRRKRDDLDGAERAISRALALAPEAPLLLCRYALVAAQAGQLEKAGELIERAQESGAEPQDVLQARCFLAMVQGDYGKASLLAHQLISENPDNPRSYMLSAKANYALGRYAKGRRHAENAVVLRPAFVDEMEPTLRKFKILSHWSMWFFIPFTQLGPFIALCLVIPAVWFIILLEKRDMTGLALAIAAVYLVILVHAFTASRTLRWLLSRDRS